MKIIVIGINHAGTSALRTLVAQNKEHEITAYDKNDNISFLGCGIALTVGGEVNDIDKLFYCNPEKLAASGITVKMNHDVMAIDYNKQSITVKNLKTDEIIIDQYDKLIYAAGSWPIELSHIPKENRNLKNIEICKLYQHAKELICKANSSDIKNIAIIGAGYIGVELAEAYLKKGKTVVLVDFKQHVLSRYIDNEFVVALESDMRNHGLILALGEKVIDFSGENGQVKKLTTDKNSYDVDLVIECIGFKPNSELLPDAKKTTNGAIIVDKFMQTSISNIYAIGDVAAIYHAALDRPEQVALATNAVKSGITAASNINGNTNVKIDSIVGTSAICVFSHNIASTGITEATAKLNNIDIACCYIEDNDRPEFMKSYNPVKFKLVYDKKNLRLLGAQVDSYGKSNHTEIIFYLALAIQQKLNLFDLACTDIYFLPHFNKPFNFVLRAIMQVLEIDYV